MASPSRAGRRWKSGVHRLTRATTAETGSTSWTPRPSSSGIPESQGSILTVHNNGGDGIFVATGSLSFFGAGTGLSHDQRVQQWRQRDRDWLRWCGRESFWGGEVHDREQPEERFGCWRRGQCPDHRGINGAEQSDRPARGWCRYPTLSSRRTRIRRASKIILARTSTFALAPERPWVESPSAASNAMRRSSAGAPRCVREVGGKVPSYLHRVPAGTGLVVGPGRRHQPSTCWIKVTCLAPFSMECGSSVWRSPEGSDDRSRWD